MIRKIISIEQDMCDGCGLCVEACHQSAIGIVDGKATLLREDYCDGLGDCLPACPQNAITFIEKEALEFNEEALKENEECETCGDEEEPVVSFESLQDVVEEYSELTQWPVKIQLVAVNASFFENADLLIAADCGAYAYAGFHQKFMQDRVTLIGCTKLSDYDYEEKLTDIFKENDIQSICVVRMEVRCCRGLVNVVNKAIDASGKDIPVQVVTISADGKIIDEEII